MNTSESIQTKLLREVKDIPPMPDVVVKVMQITRDPNASAKQLTDQISMDQGLTSNILRLCNSAYYGLPRVVSSLTQAIMYLGFHTVRSLVLTLSLEHLFNTEENIYGFKEGGMWHHSVASAIGCELLCKRIRPDLHDTAFTAGLLHSVGQVLIGIKIKDSADSIIELMINEGLTQIEAEQQVLGISHDELGGMLADQWSFPQDLTYSIRYHRFPEKAPGEGILPSIVNIAVSIVLDLGYGVELEQVKYPPSKIALKKLKINKDSFETIRNQIKENVDEHAKTFFIEEENEEEN